MVKTSAQIKKVFTSLKSDSVLSFSNIPRKQNSYLTHGYHRYPAKFIPKLANYLILNNSKVGDTICDPFGGCGTSLVEAKVNGRSSLGIDINPIAQLISQTKITPLNPKQLDSELEKLKSRLGTSRKKNFIPSNARLTYWFDEEHLHDLSFILNNINKTTDEDMKRFFLCAFSNILKNCSRWLMKSLKPQVDPYKQPADSYITFIKQLDFMVAKNRDFFDELTKTSNLNTKSKFYLRDARDTKIKSRSIDYILTSPPYVTSYEYADLHQLSLLWFEFPKNWVAFKKGFIGTSHRMGDETRIKSSIGLNIIDQLMYGDASLAKRVLAYFQDMEKFLLEARRILKEGKKISIVIGNTTQKGVEILNAEVAFEQMSILGFKNINVEKRQTSGQSITPYRDSTTGRFTSVHNPTKRKAYEFEYIITGVN